MEYSEITKKLFNNVVGVREADKIECHDFYSKYYYNIDGVVFMALYNYSAGFIEQYYIRDINA